MAPPRDDDLAERLDRLERDLEALRRDLVFTPVDQRTPIPRPPSPRSMLRFVDEFAIPTAIAILEVNIKLLKLAHGSIRLLDGSQHRSEASDRLSQAGRTTLVRLDDTLVELEQALIDGPIPTDRNAARIIEDARAIRQEIADRLDTIATDERRIDIDDVDELDTDRIGIDIEEELDSIRAELDNDENEDEDDDDDDDDEPSDQPA